MGLEPITRRKALIGGSLVSIENVPMYRDVTLTNAQMLAIRATPITLAPAPGNARVLRLFSHAVLVASLTGAYGETADNLVVRQTNGSGVILSDAIETTGFLTATGIKANTGRRAADAIGALLNQALVLHNSGDGEFTGGNAANAVRVRCYYYDVTIPTAWGVLA
jgi:hypothetical protein